MGRVPHAGSQHSVILISSPREKWTLVSPRVGPCPSAASWLLRTRNGLTRVKVGQEASVSHREGLERTERWDWRVSLRSTRRQGRPTLRAPREEAWVLAGLQSMPPPTPGAASCPGSCSGQIHTLVSKDANSCQGKEDLFLTEIFVGESSTDNYSRLHFLFLLLCLTHTHTHTTYRRVTRTYTTYK